MKRTFTYSTCIAIMICALSVRSQEIQSQVLWQSGREGYHTYRIPALVVTNKKTILAFCEGRKRSRGDTGDIDLLVKRSTNKGKSWSKQYLVWDDGDNVCGNPCPILDRNTGQIWLLLTWNRGDDRESQIINQESKDTRRVFITHSADDGKTWAAPSEITNEVKQSDWTWYATGPGAGIQVEYGPNKGRLVAPCDHIEAVSKRYFSHIIYSDDHGRTWHVGGSTPKDQVNECQVVELADNKLLLNMRNYDRSKTQRQQAFSHDGGLTWTDQAFADSLVDPICQAGLRRYSWALGKNRNVILFSNPSSSGARVNMTIRASLDEGTSWPMRRLLHSGPSAYSDLAVLADGRIFCLYECGSKNPYETITLARLKLNDVLKD